MNKKIFRSTLSASILVLLLSIILILGILFEFFEGQLQNELKSEANYIAHAIQNEGASFLDGFDSGSKRITLISKDGSVIADTVADAEALDNHLQRAEVAEAAETGTGMSVRYSGTLMEKTVYFALLLEDGNILRVSTTQYTVFTILLGLVQPLIVVILIALLISLFLSSRVSKSIIKPINELDLDNPSENDTYEELSPLLHKISAQKATIGNQLKEAVRKQEEFELITENMNEGFLIIDCDTRILTYNSAALRLLGAEKAENESVLTLNRTKGFRNTVEKVLSGERCENSMSLNEKTYNLIANPVYSEKKLIGAVIIILDVTETVKREQLRREFTSNVSHELKTPLTSISGFAEIMKAGGTPDETVTDFSKSIYDEAQRLVSLVNDIIKISELDENTAVFEQEQVDLYELSSEIISILKPAADTKGIAFSLEGESVCITGVKRILEEMIYNLCDNAIKYNKDGGEVVITITSSPDTATLSVKDTGIGIPLADRDRVFERFYRVDKSHSKAIGGTGLGLSIVKHGAIYHKAGISLESTEGEGTCISIAFTKTN